MKLKQSSQFYPVEIGNKVIFVKRWTTKNEKEYLHAKLAINEESSEFDILDSIYESLVFPNCEREEEARQLSEPEKELLLIKMRQLSLGDTFTAFFICEHCKKKNKISLSLGETIKYTAPTFTTQKFDIDGELVDVELFENTSVPAQKMMKEETNVIDRVVLELALSIKSIKIDNEIFDSFTAKEMVEFLENEFPTLQFDELIKNYNTQKGSINTNEIKCNCQKCKKENIISFGEITNFLPW